jgi:hypothetical protein
MLMSLHFLFLLQRFERPLGILAGLLIATAQFNYLIDIFKRQVMPSPLSWYGWTALMGASLISQIISKGWEWNLTGLMLSTIGCFVIGSSAILLKNYSLKKRDWNYVVLGLLCIGIYLLSKNPWYTTCFAILADLTLSIPTFSKVYKNPQSEKSVAWFLGMASWAVSLVICINHNLLYALFPIYLFLFNVTMILLTGRRKYIHSA